MPTYYEILGVELAASAEEIKHAYYDIMKRQHPDRHGNQDDPIARLVNQAYAVLKDSTKRMSYDKFLGKFSATKPARPEPPVASAPSAVWQTNTNERKTVRIDCGWCSGSGRGRRSLDDSICIGCGGSGKQPDRPVRFPKLSIEIACRLCGGPGKNCLGIKCDECEGSGKEYLAPPNHELCPDCVGWGTKKYKDGWRRRPDRPVCDICNGNGLWPALQRRV